ncbi:hypothetical protein VPH35_076368 [Triticum aestivum]
MSGMGSRPGESNLVEPRGLPSAGMAMQPWWTGTGFGAVSPAVVAPGSGAGISLSSNPFGGGAPQGKKKTVDDDPRAESSDDDSPRSGEPKDGSFDEEKQHATSRMPALASDYLQPYSQLELNQPMASAAYPYPDAYYTGMVGPYGAQAVAHFQLPGLTHPRMPLPLEVSEEPVYVNAKQYHGILRRRQSRAKAELERKAIKARKVCEAVSLSFFLPEPVFDLCFLLHAALPPRVPAPARDAAGEGHRRPLPQHQEGRERRSLQWRQNRGEQGRAELRVPPGAAGPAPPSGMKWHLDAT